MKDKEFAFYSGNSFLDTQLISASELIPEWYKKISTNSHKTQNAFNNKSVKHCMPFLDSLTSGYLLTTNQDIEITINENNEYIVNHALSTTEENICIGIRNEPVLSPAPFAFNQITHFVWRIPFGFKTPKHYSLLITHPFNQYNLPFITTTGIVDSDISVTTPGAIPFYLQSGWTGVIPAGTPILQLLPVKRDVWKKIKDTSLGLEIEQNKYDILRVKASVAFYKKKIWQRKRYS